MALRRHAARDTAGLCILGAAVSDDDEDVDVEEEVPDLEMDECCDDDDFYHDDALR